MGLALTDTLDIHEKFKGLRKIAGALMFACFVLSIVYFLYWLTVMTNDDIYTYTKDIMAPLAQFLNPGTTDYSIFKNTAITLFVSTLPILSSFFILDALESILVKRANRIISKRTQEAYIQERIDNSKTFEAIKKFSICLSLDYKSYPEISEATQIKLNNAIFSKLKSTPYVSQHELSFDTNTFVIISDRFLHYDLMYGSLLSGLSKIKKVIEKTYPLTIIPTITTDAYTMGVSLSEVKKRHAEIKSMTSKNLAIATGTFQKKYTHLNKNKYIGTPTGAFVTSDRNSTKNYELNVVFNNLETAIR